MYRINQYAENPVRVWTPSDQLSNASGNYMKHAEIHLAKMEEKKEKLLWDCDLKEFEQSQPDALRWTRNNIPERTTFRAMYESH